jgi:hypothetical protein
MLRRRKNTQRGQKKHLPCLSLHQKPRVDDDQLSVANAQGTTRWQAEFMDSTLP